MFPPELAGQGPLFVVRRGALALGDRQHERERAALSLSADQLHPTSMRTDDLMHQRESESGPLDVVDQPGLEPDELVEYILLVAGRASQAPVRDRDAHRPVPRPGRDSDFAPLA